MSKKGHTEFAEELPKPSVDLKTECCFGAVPTNTTAVMVVATNPAEQLFCARATLFS
jgi:hypothetical protein